MGVEIVTEIYGMRNTLTLTERLFVYLLAGHVLHMGRVGRWAHPDTAGSAKPIKERATKRHMGGGGGPG